MDRTTAFKLYMGFLTTDNKEINNLIDMCHKEVEKQYTTHKLTCSNSTVIIESYLKLIQECGEEYGQRF